MSDDDLDNLLDDDPETQYHPAEDIKSIEAMKLDQKMCALFVKNKKMDPEEGKMKIETLTAMIELAEGSKLHNKEDYIDSLKESWKNHHEWMEACEDDDSLGSTKNSHITRIKKRIEKIEEELTSLGVNVENLKNDDDEDAGLLKEIDDTGGGEDVDELSDISDGEDTSYQKTAAKPVQRLPTMEERKVAINTRSSRVVNDFTNENPKELLKQRLAEYINAIEYLKKHNLTKDQKRIYEILERAETVKKLQKRGDVELYEIPGEVTPDDLLGISSMDRIKKFQAITNHINKTMNELKLIGSNNFKIHNATKNSTAKENYDRSIALFKKQAQLKKDMVELAKNRWQPLPELQTITEIFTDVKKSGEFDASISNLNVKLTVPESFQNVGKYYYKFKWMDEETALKKKKVNNKGGEVESSHPIDFGHHKKLQNLKVVIKIKHWRCGIFDKTVNNFETNLALLKKGGAIKKNFKFDDHKFYVTITVDMPMGEEEKKNLEEIKIIDVAYTAPPFKSSSGGPVERPKASTEKKSTGGAGKKSTKQPASAGAKPKSEVEVPEGVGPDEIKDPDVQRNLWSCYYCKLQGEKYQKLVNSALQKKQPVDEEIRMKMLLFQSQKIGIESAIGNNQVTFDQYMGFLNKGLEHDRVLLQYFEDIGDQAKARTVRFRIECYEKEINGEVEEDETED